MRDHVKPAARAGTDRYAAIDPSRLAPWEYPREIEFIEALRTTPAGKVQRRMLPRREEERAAGGGA